MNPVRALNFDSVSSDTSVSSANATANDSIPTTVTTPVTTTRTAIPIPNEDCHITTSLDNGRKHTNDSCPLQKGAKSENDFCSNDNDILNNDNGDENIPDECFGSSLTVEQKFEALQNYVKGLSTDEWMYALGNSASLK